MTTATNRTPIAELRSVIESARWSRHDLGGATSGEFVRMDVGTRLGAHIAALDALKIPARFVADEARRLEEIEFCRRVVARWQAKRDAAQAAA